MSPVDFELHPPNRFVALFLPALLGVVLPAAAVLALALGPAQRTPMQWAGALPLLAMPVIGLFMAWNFQHRRVRLSDAGLRLRALPWPRTVPLAEFDLEHAEIADLDSRRELRPFIKLIGTRLPGYQAGRFRLRDKRTAFVLLTDLRRVLVLPRRNGGVVLLSVQRPEALLQAMRKHA
jgi:hypothetical protein